MESTDKKTIVRKVIKFGLATSSAGVTSRLINTILIGPNMPMPARIYTMIGSYAVGTAVGNVVGENLDQTVLNDIFGDYPEPEVENEE
jgi:hypothetical protein